MMRPNVLMEGIVGLANLAEASGMPTTERVWALLVTTLALVDREMPMGTPRDEWLSVCAHVYDQARGALASGEAS